jgi:hypothetical protein
MPIPWLALPATFTFAAPDICQEIVDDRLVIEWRTKTAYLEESKVVFGGGVKATYGVTTLTADRLTIYYSPPGENGIAEGNVRILDPEGTIDADRLQFNWRNRTGEASRVRVDVYPMLLEAQTLKVQPGQWDLTNVKIMQCGGRPALVEMWSPAVTIRPGRNSVAKELRVSILGQRVATLRRHEVSLDRKNEGIKLPSVSIRRGAGLGITWQNGVPLTNSTYTDLRFSAFPERRPSASLTVSRSFLDPDNVQTLLTPRSDIAELFNFGYLENINVESPERERDSLSKMRATVSVGSVMNAGVPGRPTRDSVTKPWEIVTEVGGVKSGMPQFHQIRLQNIYEVGGKAETRLIALSTVKSPDFRVAPEITASVRGDGRLFFNQNGGQAGWGRVIGEMIWRPNAQFRLAAGYALGANSGDFAFGLDALPREESLHIRSDLLLGPTRINILAKYDPRRSSWFDHELAIYQIAGCFEPYYIFRSDIGTSSFGVRFRVFEAFDRLKDRVPKRTKFNRPPPPKMDGHGMFGWPEDFGG